MARLSYDFYDGDTVEIARKLLGKILVRTLDAPPDGVSYPDAPSIDGGSYPDTPERGPVVLAGRITETEAYIGRCDKACHAFGYRRTKRTAPLFLGPAHAYIYLIYGMHCCLNLVTEPEGEPAAVLIRAMEAVTGAEFMRRRRYGDRPMTPARERNLLNGPGKICQALALTRSENGLDLTGNALFVCDSPSDIGLSDVPPRREIIRAGPRIGIDYAEEARDFPWRFTLEPDLS